MNAHEKTSAPLRGAEHYNQIDPSPNVRKSLDTTVASFRVAGPYCLESIQRCGLHEVDSAEICDPMTFARIVAGGASNMNQRLGAVLVVMAGGAKRPVSARRPELIESRNRTTALGLRGEPSSYIMHGTRGKFDPQSGCLGPAQCGYIGRTLTTTPNRINQLQQTPGRGGVRPHGIEFGLLCFRTLVTVADQREAI
jgi:hypothetical protein